MIRAAVIGKPVLHSLSPIIFNGIFKKYNIDAHYLRITADSYSSASLLLRANKINFYNITAPFKKDAFDKADIFSDEALLAMNSNLIIINQKQNAYNTDVKALISVLQLYQISNDSQVLILGGGAVAETANLVLRSLKFSRIDAAVRNVEKLKIVSKVKWDNVLKLTKLEHSLNYNLIINTIPKFNLNYNLKNIALIDYDYNKNIKNISNFQFINGLELLIRQAVPAFKLFFDLNIGFNEIYDLISNNYTKKKNIFLTGFMASGKSTVGRLLAEKIGYDFIDIDSEIENSENKIISEIFKSNGEKYFRQIEQQVIKKFLKFENQVIAFGGGALINNQFMDLIQSSGYIIYLYADFDCIKERIKNDSFVRPLADKNNLKDLFSIREETYFRCADLIVNNSNDLNDTIELLENEINSTIKS